MAAQPYTVSKGNALSRPSVRPSLFLLPLAIGFLALAALAGAGPASAKTIVVPKDHGTIQGAVNAAADGDTIEIRRAKTYVENVTVPKNRLKIVGAAKEGEVIVDGAENGVTNNPTFFITGNNVRLRKLFVRHGRNGVDCEAFGCRLERVKVKTEEGNCVEATGNGFKLHKSRLLACGGSHGLHLTGSKFEVTGNLIRLADDACADITGDEGLIRNNSIHNCEDDDAITLNGDRNLVESNRLRNTDDRAIDIGGNRNRIVGNYMTNIESDCVEADGNGTVLRKNRIVGCRDSGIDADGHGTRVLENFIFAASTTSTCVEIIGRNAFVRENRMDICDGAIDIDGENPKVIGNVGVRIGDDDGVYISCGDDAGGGAPANEACSGLVVRNNSMSGNNNDDEGYDVYADPGTGSGAQVVGNASFENNDGGFRLRLNGARIADNVSRVDGAEGNEHSFDIAGNGNTIEDNLARESGADGFELNGDNNTIRRNTSLDNLYDGLHLTGGNNNRLLRNTARRNGGDGIENDGTDSVIRKSVSEKNRKDCTNDGTIAVKEGNRCADGSNFNVPGHFDH